MRGDPTQRRCQDKIAHSIVSPAPVPDRLPLPPRFLVLPGVVGAWVSGTTGDVTLAPVPVLAIRLLETVVAKLLVTCTARLVVWFEESVSVAVATTPLDIVVEFTPASRQVYEPLPPKQLSDFDATLALAPTAIFMDVKSAVE